MARNIPIKVARAEKDMTQKALAEAVGISRQTMNAIEQGEYNPTIKLCRSICRVLGKSLDELFWEDEEQERVRQMKKRKNKLDEMQEQKMLHIESRGCWIAFIGLMAVIAAQLVYYGRDCGNQIIGETIVFLCMGCRIR